LRTHSSRKRHSRSFVEYVNRCPPIHFEQDEEAVVSYKHAQQLGEEVNGELHFSVNQKKPEEAPYQPYDSEGEGEEGGAVDDFIVNEAEEDQPHDRRRRGRAQSGEMELGEAEEGGDDENEDVGGGTDQEGHEGTESDLYHLPISLMIK
jgi:hypothetical protein